jgi:hypothetical protein
MFISRTPSQLDISYSQSSPSDSKDVVRSVLDETKLNELDDLFKNFIDQTKDDIILFRYEHNITSIYNAFKQVLTSETDLIGKVTRLRNDNKDLSQKYAQAIRLSTTDQTTRDELIEQLDKAWQQASLAKSKEKRALETLNSLKLEVSNLSKLVEQVVGLTMGQENSLREVIKEKEDLAVDHKILNGELENLKLTLKDMKQKEIEQEKLVDEASIRVAQADQDLLVANLQNQQYSRQIEKLQDENLNLKRFNEGKEASLAQLNQTMNALKLEITRLEQIIKENQQSMEKSRKENDMLVNRFSRLQTENDQHFIKNETIMLEYSQLELKLKVQEDQLEVLRNESIYFQKTRDSFDKKFSILEQEKQELLQSKQLVGCELENANKKIDKLLKDLEISEKKLKNILNEKDLQSVEIAKLKLKKDKIEADLNQTQVQVKNYQIDKKACEKEILRLNSQIKNFDQERSKNSYSKNILLNKLDSVNHDLKLKYCDLKEKEKNLDEYEIKLGKLTKLHESISAERQSLLKLNNEAKEQIIELNKQNESLNLDVASKASFIKQNKIDFERICVENSKLEKSLNQCREQLDESLLEKSESKKQINNLAANEVRILNIISDLNDKIKLKTKAYERIQLERNIFGTQLLRRNDEISCLYEKIKLVQELNNRGQLAFEKMASEYRLNEILVNNLKKEKEMKTNENKTLRKFKKKFYACQEECLLEKAKRSIAESNQAQSVKTHRWRRLRCSDPSKYDLIVKVNFLQKKLITKTLEIANLNLKFQEKDRLFIELSKSLTRRLITQDNSNLVLEHRIAIQTRDKQMKVKASYFLILFLK